MTNNPSLGFMKYGNLDLKQKRIVFDTESTGLNPWGDKKRWGFYPARPFAYSFSDLEGNTHFIRWQVDPLTREVLVNKKDLPFLQDILEDERIEKIGHNIGFDIRMSEMTGFKVRGKLHDTLIMMHIVTGGSEMQYGLKYLGKKYLEIEDDDELNLQESVNQNRRKARKLKYRLATKETHGNDFLKADYWLADPKKLERYAVQDAVRTAMLFLLAKEDIETDEGLYETYQMEMELFWCIKSMEEIGTQVYPEKINELEKFYTEYMQKQTKIAESNGGKGLNFKSPKQMVQKFIHERKHQPIKLTATGQPSIDGDFLVSISKKDPLAKAIIEYKTANHAISSFLKPYKNFMVKENGVWVLHPNYKQCGPITGRLSCSDPNLMQVGSESSAKRKSDITLMPRKCFGPRPGCIWYAPDYSQEEVWLAMFHAEEENGIKFLLSGKSFHDQLCKESWSDEEDYKENHQAYRKKTKIIVFTKFYGGGKNKVSQELECSPEEAWEFMQRLSRQIPGVDRFMELKTREARNNGFIRTSFGRKCIVDPELCYKGMNYDIQGTAADIMKRAMIRLAKKFTGRWSGVRILLTLHDELIIEVPLKLHSKALMRDIIEAMQADSKKAGIPVPLPVSMKLIKSNWSEEIKLCDKHLDINCSSCEKK